VSFELRVRVPTTESPDDSAAAAAFEAAIAAAGSSTTTAFGASSTTHRSTTSTSTSTTAPGGTESSTTTTAGQSVAPADFCKLVTQLINFYGAIKPQTDPNDLQGTAANVGGPVQQSAKGLDQILQVAPADINPAATTVINWLRAAAAGNQFDADGAESANQQLQSWFSDHCK
jgi:hypothetical protein